MSRRDDVLRAHDAAAATYGRLYFHELDDNQRARRALSHTLEH